MLFIPTSELKERMLKTGAQAPFSVLSSAILNSYVDYRCKPVSRSSFPVPRSQILILVTMYKTCPVTRAFFQVFFIHGPHFKIYAFTCVWFWGCYMNKKFRSMPNVKRLWPPWTSSYLHNIIVTHVKHLSLYISVRSVRRTEKCQVFPNFLSYFVLLSLYISLS